NGSVLAVTQCMLQNNPLKRPRQHASSQVLAKKIASSAARDTIKINELQALARNASSAEVPLDEDEV
ncbi:hypothetical protein EC957_009592, partial [Mortierella hygrophila]